MTPQKRATISDVARKAGVSPTAVSLILNGKGLFPDHTRERVKEAAELLGYRAHRGAQYLRTGRTHAIGMVIPGSEDPLWSSQWMPVTGRLLVETAEALSKRGYVLMVIPSGSDDWIRPNEMDALIVSDSREHDPDLERALSLGIPVLTNDRLDDPRITVHVDSGYRSMTTEALSLFAKKGRKKPALLTELTTFITDAAPEKVWREWCEKHGQEALVAHARYDRSNLAEALDSLLDRGANAIFSFAGEGIALVDHIRSRGLTVPGDVMVISAEVGTHPPSIAAGVSTMVFHADQGAISVPVLIDILDNGLEAPQLVETGWEFVEAESTKAEST